MNFKRILKYFLTGALLVAVTSAALHAAAYGVGWLINRYWPGFCGKNPCDDLIAIGGGFILGAGFLVVLGLIMGGILCLLGYAFWADRGAKKVEEPNDDALSIERRGRNIAQQLCPTRPPEYIDGFARGYVHGVLDERELNQ